MPTPRSLTLALPLVDVPWRDRLDVVLVELTPGHRPDPP
jgi:hypothetical protein